MNPKVVQKAVEIMSIIPGMSDPQRMLQWANELATYDGHYADEALLLAAHRTVREHQGGGLAPGTVKMNFEIEQRSLLRVKGFPGPRTVAQCDGSGWFETEDGDRPCPRCNPAIHAVYQDPVKLMRYRNGVSLADLDVGVNRGRQGVLEWAPGMTPPSCRPATEYEEEAEPVITPRQGVAVAWAAYVDDCMSDDPPRTPNREHFNRIFGGIVEV